MNKVCRKLYSYYDRYRQEKFNKMSAINCFEKTNLDYIKCIDRSWIPRLIDYHFPNAGKKFHMYGVFGDDRTELETANANELKIFFTGENCEPVIDHKNILAPHSRTFGCKEKYMDYGIPYADVALGFGNRDLEGYVRFPLWLTYVFRPEDRYIDICYRLSAIEQTRHDVNRRAAAVISRHDNGGTRAMICDELDNVIDIKYAGAWRNNTDELKALYGDSKDAYLRQFRFNICPENVDANGYCTEKLFEALCAGVIPIYAGCEGNPEPGIINKDSVIIWNMDGDNSSNVDLIRRLNDDDRFYLEFMSRPKFCKGAAENIYYMFEKLRKEINNRL